MDLASVRIARRARNIMGHRDDYRVGGADDASPSHDTDRRREALARSIAARVHSGQRTLRDLRRIDRFLMAIEREPSNDAFKVYVAAASTDLPRVAGATAALQACGLTVMSTWPAIVANTPGGANPRDATDEARFAWSSQDLAEVEEADAILMLVPTGPTRGAWIEAGFAYATAKHVVFAGDTKQSVFCSIGEEFAEDATAIRYLVRIARDRAEARRMLAGLREMRDAAPDVGDLGTLDGRFDLTGDGNG